MLLTFMLSFVMHEEMEENDYFIFTYLVFHNLGMDGWTREEIVPSSPVIYP